MSRDDRPSGPPRLAAALLRLFGGEDGPAMAADLREEYHRFIRPGRGWLAARLWYWSQVVRSITVDRRVRRRREGGVRMGARIESVLQDVRYAVRGLVRRPAFTATAVLTLALGIGGVVAAHGILQGTLFRPLPYDRPDELVVFWDQGSWSEAEALALRAERDHLWPRGFFVDERATLRADDGPAQAVRNFRVTHEVFETLGRRAEIGRTFVEGENLPGAAPVTVLSWSLFQDLGGMPELVGTSIQLNGMPHEVVGVMPRDFYFPDRDVRVWTPVTLREGNRGGYLRVVARADFDRAGAVEAGLERITTLLGREFEYSEGWDKTQGAELIPLETEIRGDTRRPTYLVGGALVLLLLLACANVTALVLARTEERTSELSLRLALGSGRGRLGRQLLTEALVLGVVSGVTALAVAVSGFRLLRANLPLPSGTAATLALDPTVLVVSLVTAVTAGLVVGTIPAARVLRGSLSGRLGSRDPVGGRGGDRFEAGLVVAEVALALVLAGGAGLAVRSVQALSEVESGIQPQNRLVVDLIAPWTYGPMERRVQIFDAILQRVDAVPGVASVGLTQRLPLRGRGWVGGVNLEGSEVSISSYMRFVSNGYPDAVGMKLLEGRGFEAGDGANTEWVALANRSLANRIEAEEGRVIGVTADLGWGPARIVGVVADVKEGTLIETGEPALYQLFSQRPMTLVPSLVVEVAGANPTALAGTLRAAVHEVAPDVGISGISTMEAVVREAQGPIRAILPLVGALSILALILGAIGVYGVLSHDVSRRTRRWAVTLALGADPAAVRRAVVGRGMALVALGCLVGGVAFYGLARTAEALLFGVEPSDPVTIGIAVGLLALVGLGATWLPGRRAARTDPMLILRGEG